MVNRYGAFLYAPNSLSYCCVSVFCQIFWSTCLGRRDQLVCFFWFLSWSVSSSFLVSLVCYGLCLWIFPSIFYIIFENRSVPNDTNIKLIPWLTLKMCQRMTKPTKWQVCPAKTQIRLGIRPVWSGSSLCAQRPVSSLHKSIAGHYWPVRVADVPITACCRFR